MKINEEKTNSENIGIFEEEVSSSIAQENMGLALRMVSKNLYSDPEGSIVREITSNAVDANVGANEDSPVLIHLYEEDDDYYIEFKDKGVGMSPEVFKNIYMSWFNSDKRADNKRIGGWGLGSKSPLSYTDSFEITTIYNKIKYEYVFFSDGDLPKSELISKEEVDESNGTTIRILIESQDLHKFHKAIDTQLTYFNNVYVKDELRWYNNNFKIYEAEDYKIRNNKRPFGDEMHICLGQVAYPINFKIIEESPVYIPIGLKFDIGELDVVLSREEINYTPRTKEAIINKLVKVKAKLLENYKDRLTYKDLFSFIIAANSNDSSLPPLTIKDISIPMRGIKAEISFIGFKGYNIKKSEAKQLFNHYKVFKLQGGRIFKNSVKGNHVLWNYTNNCYLYEKPDYWNAKYIENANLVQRKKITKQVFREYAEILGLTFETNNKRIVVRTENRTEYENIGTTYTSLKNGASFKVYRIIKLIDNYLKEKLKTFSNQAPQDWIDREKALKAIKKDRNKGEFTHYSLNYNKRSTMKFADLADFKVVFFIYKDMDEEDRKLCNKFWNSLNKSFRKKALLLSVSKTVAKQLLSKDNTYFFPTVFKVPSINNYLARLKLFYEYKSVLLHNISCSNYYNNKLSNAYKLLGRLDERFYKEYKSHIDIAVSNNTKYDYLKKDLEEVKSFITSKEYIIISSLSSLTAKRAFTSLCPVRKLNHEWYDSEVEANIRERKAREIEEAKRKLRELTINNKS